MIGNGKKRILIEDSIRFKTRIGSSQNTTTLYIEASIWIHHLVTDLGLARDLVNAGFVAKISQPETF